MPIRMGDTIELTMRVWPNDLDINGSSADARGAIGLGPLSPAFPPSICAWIEAERLMSA
ncbi:MAG TPA: hypothetical protein VF861_08775 [Telluria sp.]